MRDSGAQSALNQTVRAGGLDHYSERIRFSEGDCIFRAGTIGDCCYIIESGEVRLEVEGLDPDFEGILSFLRPGAVLGELSLLDREERSASAYANSEVILKKISKHSIEALCAQSPSAGLTIYKALGKDTAWKLRQTTRRLADYLTHDEEPDAEIQKMVDMALKAQRMFQSWSNDRLDQVLKAVALEFADKAEDLAISTVLETKLGNVQDKTSKNRFAALNTYVSVSGMQVPGILRNPALNLEEVYGPAGVVLVLLPVTAPVATMIWTALMNFKARNAVIFSIPRLAQSSASSAAGLIHAVLNQHGAPEGLIQTIGKCNSWKSVVCLCSEDGISRISAFGSGELIRAANSSGKPVAGVVSGAAPVWICEDADLEFAASLIVNSKSFDNGLMPGAESCLIVHSNIREKFAELLEKYGAAVLTRAEEYLFSTQIIDSAQRKFKHSIMGQSAKSIARGSGISRNYPIQLLVVPRSFDYPDHPYCREIPAPLVSMFTVENDEEAMLLFRILQMGGNGESTAYVYTTDRDRIARLGMESGAGRVTVNCPATKVQRLPGSAEALLVHTAISNVLALKDFCKLTRIFNDKERNVSFSFGSSRQHASSSWAVL